MCSGEMTEDEFAHFLTKTFELASSHAARGAIVYTCMDWRHMGEMLAASNRRVFRITRARPLVERLET